ncbi:MAG TPA: PDZ domain-containing protein [Planctomycetaceae bacterium]|nr:PDZ domain-containing protein [Planctomycetaceae bacterium]
MNAGFRWMFSTVVATGLFAAPAARAQDDGSASEPARVPRAIVVSDETAEVVLDTNQPQAAVRVALPSRWVGLHGQPADETLRKQLGLPEGQGLVVRTVVDDSPAAKAGIEPHDILLSANDTPLGQVEHLLKVVGETGEGQRELKFKLLRGGKEQTVSVAPAERPQALNVTELAGVDTQDLILSLGPNDKRQLRDLVELHLVRPGVVVGFAGTPGAALPKDLKITITREGDQLARIKVEREGRGWWGATEKELDTLPDDVRPYVERMLGRGRPFQATLEVERERAGLPAVRSRIATLPRVQLTQPAQPAPPQAASLQKQLDELNARLKELQKAIEALQAKD